MRAFLAACLAIVIIGTGGYFFLDSMQESAGEAFSTDGARINPQWSWRAVFDSASTDTLATNTAMTIPEAPSELAEDCTARTASQWLFVDFGTPARESDLCKISQ
ncbi:MAG: hypothetical protein ABSE22_07690 [Xanthobacteraceae bacterium]|jgi:hypothetical protein